MDTLAFGCNLPTIRAVWGLAPVRVRSCWANNAIRQGYPCLIENQYSVGIYICCGLFTPVAADGWESFGSLIAYFDIIALNAL